jgi:phosphopantetheine adenylyltransferase
MVKAQSVTGTETYTRKKKIKEERKSKGKKEIQLYIIGVDILQLGFVHTAAKYIINNLLLYI